MAKIDNIPLNDKECFKKPSENRVKSVVVNTLKPVEGSKSIRVTKEQLLKVVGQRQSLKTVEELQQKVVFVGAEPDPKANLALIPRLCKRGLMQYINRHSLEHLNPSETKKMSKEELKHIATHVKHVK